MAGGRPLKWKTPEEMQVMIDAYFASCYDVDEETGKKRQIVPFTITGLANSLDTNRETLLNYEERDEFFDTIKRAKSRVEQNVEELLLSGKAQVGAIFNLKNNFKSWKDKNETDITSNGKTINGNTVIFKEFSEYETNG